MHLQTELQCGQICCSFNTELNIVDHPRVKHNRIVYFVFFLYFSYLSVLLYEIFCCNLMPANVWTCVRYTDEWNTHTHSIHRDTLRTKGIATRRKWMKKRVEPMQKNITLKQSARCRSFCNIYCLENDSMKRMKIWEENKKNKKNTSTQNDQHFWCVAIPTLFGLLTFSKCILLLYDEATACYVYTD